MPMKSTNSSGEGPARRLPSASVTSIELARSLSSQSDKRVDILRRIGETGSISEAARNSGISYKAAWQAIETLENLAGGKLVEKAVGGVRGGGTRLTETGRQVIVIADRLAQARAQVLASFSGDEQPIAGSLDTAGSILTSVRNNLPCTVEDIHHGPALVRVHLRLDAEHVIKSAITQESAQLLGLERGMRLIAAAKATAVDIAKAFPPDDRYENVLKGIVVRCARSDKGGEVTLKLSGGLVIVGFAHRGHKLRAGVPAEASIPSNAIIIGKVSGAAAPLAPAAASDTKSNK